MVVVVVVVVCPGVAGVSVALVGFVESAGEVAEVAVGTLGVDALAGVCAAGAGVVAAPSPEPPHAASHPIELAQISSFNRVALLCRAQVFGVAVMTHVLPFFSQNENVVFKPVSVR